MVLDLACGRDDAKELLRKAIELVCAHALVKRDTQRPEGGLARYSHGEKDTSKPPFSEKPKKP